MRFDSNRDTVLSRSSSMDIDEGLRAYMLKVYNYMIVGLLVTAGVSYFLPFTPLMSMFFSLETGKITLFGWVAILAPAFLSFMITSAAFSGDSSKAFLLFMVYSALMGVSLTSIFWVYTGESLLRVFLITAGTFASMSLYGYTTKKDLTSFGTFLFMGLVGIIIASLVNLFIKSSALYMMVSVFGVVVFVGLTAWDTWKIREMYNSSEDEEMRTGKAIYGALRLYMDFINLFIYLLRLFGSRRD